MSTLGQRVDAAIRGSGKTAKEIEETLDVAPDTIGRIRRDEEDNPKVQVLIGIARETNTTIGALLAGSFVISPEDEHELLRFRGWIDSKLATDALQEPNAEIIRETAPSVVRRSRVADPAPQPGDHSFTADAHLVLRALGKSMIEAGILPDDTLYATAPGTGNSAIGKIIACRIGDGVYVKRLVTEHKRRYLMSAHPHYRPIAVDSDRLTFELLGIIVGRTGRIA
jgi:transcriptional regulator with XRE-family HTH domain